MYAVLRVWGEAGPADFFKGLGFRLTGTDSNTLCDLCAHVCFAAALAQEMRESEWLNI